MRNKSSAAVMARRHEKADSLDFYRTPAWATNALVDALKAHALHDASHVILDPCSGGGDMSDVLKAQYQSVLTGDIHQHEESHKPDFMWDFTAVGNSLLDNLEIDVDWVIANPPFNLASEFIHSSLSVARRGVAILGRIQLLEGVSRFNDIWSRNACQLVYIFSERLGFAKGNETAVSSAACHAWFIWLNDLGENLGAPNLHWIEPGSKS